MLDDEIRLFMLSAIRYESVEPKIILYHVTPSKNRASIERLGLLPHHDPEIDQIDIPAVYLMGIPPEQSCEGVDVWEVNTRGLKVEKDPWQWPEGSMMWEIEPEGFGVNKGGSWYVAHDIAPDRLRLM